METQSNSHDAGADFDKWFDFNGTVDTTSPSITISTTNDKKRPTRPVLYPVSPTSPTLSDGLSSTTKSHTYTAPSTTGPLTPSHSSGSPELYSASIYRLSGDTLREEDASFRQINLKRKLSNEDDLGPEEKVPRAKQGGSKRPHNVIEKRYRANLNDKIAELRDSVPSLRLLQKAKNKEGGNVGSDEEDLDGLTPSGKLNKASILTKAVEYIRHLEFRNRRLEDENKSLKERVQTLDRVLAQGGHDARRAAAFTTENVIEQSSPDASGKSPSDSPADAPSRGMIPLSDAWKRMRQQQQSQDHYGHVYQNTSDRSRLGGKWTSRIMLGSLAGLMVVDGLSEHEQGTDSREKGLFGIPLEIMDGWKFLVSPRAYLSFFTEYCRSGGIVPMAKGFIALTILAFFIFSYLFNSRPQPEGEYEKESQAEPQSARPASPIEVRRRAWSTSMQALDLPHHSFFPEWLAVTYEWITYTVRYLLGPPVYQWLTGRSMDDEIARIKAWDIAIDAQLAGGDPEVSRSRLVLTIFGSGTLPQTPMRLMQKALHCRLLLWDIGLPGTTASALASYAATLFANRQWRHARALHEKLSSRDTDRLPGYLNYLLQMDCDDVFNDIVAQRASNLMYDRPTSEHVENSLMDVVVEDHAIRSPLDAIAAWRSTYALHEALFVSLRSPDSPDLLREHIQAALEIAPPGSAAETRALAVHAVLSPGRRSAFYNKAKEAISGPSATPEASVAVSDATVPYFIDSSTPVSARPEITACLEFASAMLTLEQERNLPKTLDKIVDFSDSSYSTSVPSIYVACSSFFVLYRIWRASGSTGSGLEQCTALAADVHSCLCAQKLVTTDVIHTNTLSNAIEFLRSKWNIDTISPNAPGSNSLIHTPSVTQAQSRRYSLISNDTGYASLSEQEDDRLGAVSDALKLTPLDKGGNLSVPVYTAYDSHGATAA